MGEVPNTALSPLFLKADGDYQIRKSGTQPTSILLNKTKNTATPCPRKKVVMIAMNDALEDVYKKVFTDSYQHVAPLSSRGS
ncbi:unnamed protein product [Lupinus luteus]|uniref:Uncharacterized protein n=1 Tax=Lupinus luteus TaxID=3873 RepID=A0AAV1WKZ4_LUPLU